MRSLEPGAVTISGAPEGFDALLLADLVARAQKGDAHRGPVLHVARDDRRASTLAEALAVVAPDLPVLRFPAWDCLPYDRVSPNPDVVSQRMATLAALAAGADFPCIVLATVNAVTQKVPPRDVIAAQSWASVVGQTFDLDELTAYLARNGYHRASTVTEPGDFAIRGGVIDIFPPGHENPVRLDLFGDVLDGARRFDAATQRSLARIKRVELAPISETLLDEASIARFRTRYREAFGAAGTTDPLYASVSEGMRFQGMEHWLPLFHERLETLFDYLPGALVSFDHLSAEAHAKRWETIEDHYSARAETLREAAPSAGLAAGQVYKPVRPETLYLDADALAACLDARPVRRFTPHRQPPGPGVIDVGGRHARDFIEERKS
ncbi:MAG: transcription-repair coupling factor, partial [Neomegalonema sp.]|nr:transcription-repair coupling factor [Neomegalonema sp.]